MITTKYATEVIDNLMGGHGPDSESKNAYAYDLEIALPVIKNWLIEKMNDKIKQIEKLYEELAIQSFNIVWERNAERQLETIGE